MFPIPTSVQGTANTVEETELKDCFFAQQHHGTDTT